MRVFPSISTCTGGQNKGHAVYVEVMEELCAEEGRSVVAETMAPFEDQLVELQREKDVAAIQVCEGSDAP